MCFTRVMIFDPSTYRDTYPNESDRATAALFDTAYEMTITGELIPREQWRAGGRAFHLGIEFAKWDMIATENDAFGPLDYDSYYDDPNL